MITQAFKKLDVNKIVLGVDRVARDGSVANKIGSTDIARIASFYDDIHFYYSTSYSTIDLETYKGENIPIEERDIGEITEPYLLDAKYKKEKGIISKNALDEWPPKNKISEKIPEKGEFLLYNPAFDLTPPRLIDLIILDIGVMAPDQIKTLTPESIQSEVRSRIEKWGLVPPNYIKFY